MSVQAFIQQEAAGLWWYFLSLGAIHADLSAGFCAQQEVAIPW